MKYIYNKDYFLDNEDDTVVLFNNSVDFGFDSDRGGKLSNKVLSILYKSGKPYVSLEGEEIEKVLPTASKPKAKTKKKKIKIDEPKEEPIIKNTESNEEES